jgi:glycosyltransferase involved in cell wall biosynthesis
LRIVYDVRNYGGTHGGIARYVAELVSEMASIEDDNVTFLAPIFSEPLFCKLSQVEMVGRYLRPIRLGRRLAAEINGAIARLRLPVFAPEIVHEMYYYRKSCKPLKGRTVITVYDMIDEKLSDKDGRKNSFRGRWDRSIKIDSIRRADHVICISTSTRNDVIELLDLEPGKVSVVHLGCRIPRHLPSQRLVSEPYLLYVGNRGGYKNFTALFLAYARNSRLSENFRLVCFGGGPFSDDERSMIGTELAEGEPIQLGGGDDVLTNLYAHSSAVVYPSLYEGFGLPPLEAMAHGCPAICSNTSSLPEVVGDAAELFDPADVDAIAYAMERVVFSDARTASLHEAGRKRAELFSWNACARKTRAIYEAII